MSLMNILAAAQNGNYFANVAKACGISEGDAKLGLEKLCPAIATQLKAKAASDPDSFENLLDLLEEGGDSSDLDDAEAVTGGEAISDGNAVLKDIYGDSYATEISRLAPKLDEAARSQLAAIGATSVLAALAQSYSAPNTLAGSTAVPEKSSGILGTIISAVIAGAVQGAVRQLAPKRRRRRRSYTSYFGTRRKPVRRRRKKTVTLDDLFGQILGTKR